MPRVEVKCDVKHLLDFPEFIPEKDNNNFRRTDVCRIFIQICVQATFNSVRTLAIN